MSLSLSLWAAALVYSPAPADAAIVLYPTNVPYWACSGYQSISPQNCYISAWGANFTFYGKMTNTIPLSYCGGGCNGTANLLVQSDPGNGRKTNTGGPGQCLGNYLFNVTFCANCT